MKEAYVSLIIPFPDSQLTSAKISELDSALNEATRNHEIVIVDNFYSEVANINIEGLSGPITVILTNPNSTENSARVAALGRAAGDFVIEWQGHIEDLTLKLIDDFLDPTNQSTELVEFESQFQGKISQFFYKITNSLRPSQMPVRKTLGRSFSRRALGLLMSRTRFEPQINILFAELAVQRMNKKVPLKFRKEKSFSARIFEGSRILIKGSRFGTVVPLVLSTISGLFGIFVAIYASCLFIFSGKSPEGWTTLMVVIGLGQASILALIGMTWSRIDSISKGMSSPADATSEVIVYPATI